MTVEIDGAYCDWLRLFRVNNIDADIEDFGKCYDDRKEDAPRYGCGNMCSHSYEEPPLGILNKYNINMDEWEIICDRLCNELYWRRCALCQ